MLSVLIATKNRPEKIMECVKSLLTSTSQSFKIIVIDQSDNKDTQKVLESLQSKKVQYLSVKKQNKSHAINKGMKYIQSEIVAFTDDDCLVDKDWIEQIIHAFKKYPSIVGVFGKTSPYQPNKHKNLICSSVFNHSTSHLIEKMKPHFTEIGLGNNMAFRKSSLSELGGFKEWLGPGSIGMAAEDAEIALRALSFEKKLFFNSEMIVFHNSWQTNDEYAQHELSYLCGEMACYGYFALKGYSFAWQVIMMNFFDCYRELKTAISATAKSNFSTLRYGREFFKRFVFRLRGVLVGLFFGIKGQVALL